jgi:hypothetical protein
MKLTNRQLESLATDLAKKINAKYEKAKVDLKKKLGTKLLTKKEEKAFRLIEQGIKLLEDANIQVITGSSWKSDDFKRLTAVKSDYVNDDKGVELDKQLKAQGYMQFTPSQIEDQLVLASIDADSLDSLVKNLAKTLGLKAEDLK